MFFSCENFRAKVGWNYEHHVLGQWAVGSGQQAADCGPSNHTSWRGAASVWRGLHLPLSLILLAWIGCSNAWGQPGSGDFNGDGRVDAADLLALSQCTTLPSDAVNLVCAAADVDVDGFLTASDYLGTQRSVSGPAGVCTPYRDLFERISRGYCGAQTQQPLGGFQGSIDGLRSVIDLKFGSLCANSSTARALSATFFAISWEDTRPFVVTGEPALTRDLGNAQIGFEINRNHIDSTGGMVPPNATYFEVDVKDIVVPALDAFVRYGPVPLIFDGPYFYVVNRHPDGIRWSGAVFDDLGLPFFTPPVSTPIARWSNRKGRIVSCLSEVINEEDRFAGTAFLPVQFIEVELQQFGIWSPVDFGQKDIIRRYGSGVFLDSPNTVTTWDFR